MSDQKSPDHIDVVIVGSIGLDTIETKFDKQVDLLGGSVSYACAASAMYAPTGMVGVIGDDFPREYIDLYREFGINLDGLVKETGKTFKWSGVYDDDMINRRTISTELNVFESFQPELPESYVDAPFLLLGNISPELQLHVLESAKKPEFVVADTMDLWINIAKEPLMEVISKVSMLTLNDSEIRLLTGEHNLKKCAQIVRGWGPDYVVVKKGEHGAMLLSESGIFLVPAYPVDEVHDPTGAGDSFAGGFMGHLAASGAVNDANVKEALLTGAVVASFGVEAFSMESFKGLGSDAVNARLAELKDMIAI